MIDEEESEKETFNKEEGNRTIVKSKVHYRALVRYPQCTQLPCRIKGCVHKKRNGRCGLKECYLELDEHYNLTGICLCFKEANLHRAIDVSTK